MMNVKTEAQAPNTAAQSLPFAQEGEKLLQFIWQFQFFNRAALQTTEGEPLEIIFPGKFNTNQGPDFLEAQLRIGSTLFVGSVELHLQTSIWEKHGHTLDSNYNNVILHVVMDHDQESNLRIPVLELQTRVSRILLERYTGLMHSSNFIPCAGSVPEIRELSWLAWQERLLAERLTRKSQLIFAFLSQNQFHWEESFWWILARNFGMKVNSEAFEAIARSLPTTVLAKHKTNVIQLESLLLGQAGLLGGRFREDYPGMLQREHRFLKKKYGLQPIHMPVHFLRMRPGNFPTVRLAQLAGLVQNSAHLFSKILELEKVAEVKKMFDVVANDYWHYHYVFDELSAFRKKSTGKDMIENLIINTVVPVLFAYGLHRREEKFKIRALDWLHALGAESNNITRGYVQLGFSNNTAFDSQSLIELKAQYCDQKHCLKCAVGNALLRPAGL
jgi:hypothetical protein